MRSNPDELTGEEETTHAALQPSQSVSGIARAMNPSSSLAEKDFVTYDGKSFDPAWLQQQVSFTVQQGIAQTHRDGVKEAVSCWLDTTTASSRHGISR
jgi:hypothetical protein